MFEAGIVNIYGWNFEATLYAGKQPWEPIRMDN
jgi:hypothetical protein